jgi:hypothetical protein
LEAPHRKKTSGSQQALLLQMGTTHLCHQRAVLLHPDVWCGALDFRHEIAGANVIFGGHAAVLTVAATNPFLAGSLNALKEISLAIGIIIIIINIIIIITTVLWYWIFETTGLGFGHYFPIKIQRQLINPT